MSSEDSNHIVHHVINATQEDRIREEETEAEGENNLEPMEPDLPGPQTHDKIIRVESDTACQKISDSTEERMQGDIQGSDCVLVLNSESREDIITIQLKTDHLDDTGCDNEQAHESVQSVFRTAKNCLALLKKPLAHLKPAKMRFKRWGTNCFTLHR